MGIPNLLNDKERKVLTIKLYDLVLWQYAKRVVPSKDWNLFMMLITVVNNLCEEENL